MATAEKQEHTYASIWRTLSAVDVSEYVQDKGGLSYLSWAWAWGVMMEHFPELEIRWQGQNGQVSDNGNHNRRDMPDVFYYEGGSAMVSCQITIGKCWRECWLPVMDFRSKALAKPDARDISDSKMRCMVKCFALFGLGHYIYAGEDLPRTPEAEDKKKQAIQRVADLIDVIKTTGAQLEDSGTVLPEDLRVDILKAFERKNEADLNEVFGKLKAIGQE